MNASLLTDITENEVKATVFQMNTLGALPTFFKKVGPLLERMFVSSLIMFLNLEYLSVG